MKNRTGNIVGIGIGVTLMLLSIFFLRDNHLKSICGVCLGLGAGILGMSASNLIMQNWYKNHPNEKKQSEIDYKDERNTAIRDKAKAKCSDIMQWAVMAIAWITILADFPLWITLLLVGAFLMKNLLDFYLIARYNKEM